MTHDRQSRRAPPGTQADVVRDGIDERCFSVGTPEHAKALTACRQAKTYLSDGETESAFRRIEHQILNADCAEVAGNLIQQAKEK